MERCDNLQSQVQEYTKKHEKNGLENIIINYEIDLDAKNPKLNMFTNTKEDELHDLTYEYSSTLKKKKKKKKKKKQKKNTNP